MPPRTRATKVSKGLKENIDTNNPKTKAKAAAKVTKVVRKPLADKTNSASDDNGSIEVAKVIPKKMVNSTQTLEANDKDRPRRERRPPTRFIEDVKEQETVQNTSQGKIKWSNQIKAPNDQGKQNVSRDQAPKEKKTNSKSNNKVSYSPFKTPQDLNNSLVANRPKRIHRLPSKFDDHSITPNKFIPVQPCFASTPIGKQNTAKEYETTPVKKPTENGITDKPKRPLRKAKVQKSVKKQPESYADNSSAKRQVLQKSLKNNGLGQKITIRNAGAESSKHSPTKRPLKAKDIELILSGDNNNNPNNERPAKSTKHASPKKAAHSKVSSQQRRIINKSFSFRVLEEKEKSPKNPQEKLAVYDFTFDPNEEPPPQKKKRKRVVNKKGPAKPRVVRVKNNYEANLAKNLASLKQAVTKAGPETGTHPDKIVLPTVPEQNVNGKSTEEAVNNPTRATSVETFMPALDTMDYSPVALPNNNCRPQVKMSNINETRDQIRTTRATSLRPDNLNHDPLNLLEEMSFFDEVPVASSSMNTSVRHPTASPWRVEFNNLPIKWQSDIYIKPNMTPAVECSFINLSDKKKHVYTNILPEANTSLPVPDEPENKLVQPSIIDFMREMAIKSLNKKRNKNSVTPTKKTTDQSSKTPNKDDNATNNVTPNENMSPLPPPINSSISTLNDTENSDPKQTSLKRKNSEEPSELPAKSPRHEANADNFFGFDDSENQENISPRKVDKQRARVLRPRSRAVLSEINAISGPLRAKIPLAAKNKFAPSSEVVNKLFDEMKAANPSEMMQKEVEKEKEQEPEKQKEKDVAQSDTSDPSWQESVVEDTDSQSVHLFEDIDEVHYLKPVRKSYGKAKKVTFQRGDSMAQETAAPDEDGSEDEEDPLDLPFQVPAIKQKKVSSKKKKKGLKLTKKEEEEVEAWAAAFNSMCEDVEEFPLVME